MKKKRRLRPLMDFDRRARGRMKRDPEHYRFEQVPISKIELREPWNAHRLKNNLYLAKTTRQMPPVLLCHHKKTQTFGIEDGIHRTNVAKMLGYTHVPAIVWRERRKR